MNNIENKIKKEFQQRVIQPQVQSWDKLTVMLDKTKVKKSRKRIIFLQYAAIFIGLLVVLSFFFKENNSVNNQVNINNELVKIINEQRQDHKIDTNTANVAKSIDNSNTNRSVNIDRNNKQSNSIIKTKHKVNFKKKLLVNKGQVLIAKNTKANRKINIKSKNNVVAPTVRNKTIIFSKIENKNVVVQNKKQNATKKSIEVKNKKILMNSSDNDIDSMLAIALDKNPEKANYSLVVKANKLQIAVENDLNTNKSTKYKIFKAIKTGVDTVETLIVSNDN